MREHSSSVRSIVGDAVAPHRVWLFPREIFQALLFSGVHGSCLPVAPFSTMVSYDGRDGHSHLSRPSPRSHCHRSMAMLHASLRLCTVLEEALDGC